MVSALLALIGAVVYGSADFFGGLAARRLRSIVVTAISAIGGITALLLALPILGGVWSIEDVAWGALAGIFGVIALALLYACLAIGPMSILSPLTAVVSAIAPMLWGLLVSGETLAPIGYAGLGVALIAVVLVGFIPGGSVATAPSAVIGDWAIRPDSCHLSADSAVVGRSALIFRGSGSAGYALTAAI